MRRVLAILQPFRQVAQVLAKLPPARGNQKEVRKLNLYNFCTVIFFVRYILSVESKAVYDLFGMNRNHQPKRLLQLSMVIIVLHVMK